MSQSVVALRVKLEARTRQDGAVWLAWCPALDVMTQAESEQRAIEALQEAIELWFESCVARNVLDQALTEAGFHRWTSGEEISEDTSVGGAAEHDGFIEVSIPAYVGTQYEPSSEERAPR